VHGQDLSTVSEQRGRINLVRNLNASPFLSFSKHIVDTGETIEPSMMMEIESIHLDRRPALCSIIDITVRTKLTKCLIIEDLQQGLLPLPEAALSA
jgi:hypothetical protein